MAGPPGEVIPSSRCLFCLQELKGRLQKDSKDALLKSFLIAEQSIADASQACGQRLHR